MGTGSRVIVDFHSHTNASDGTLTPDELVAAMRERNVGIFSITDHDTLDAYTTLRGKKIDATVIPGVEINCSLRGGEVHVLGYKLPLEESNLSRILREHRSSRFERAKQMVSQLNAAGIPLTFEQVQAEAVGSLALGRPHVGKALVRHRHVKDIQAVFRDWLVTGKPGYVPQDYILPYRAVELIKDAGGVAVLAHPGRLKDEAVIEDLAKFGLDGLEVFYPTHSPQQIAFYRSQAKEHKLVMTAGSDFHDIRWHARGVGMEVEKDDIQPFLDLILN